MILVGIFLESAKRLRCIFADLGRVPDAWQKAEAHMSLHSSLRLESVSLPEYKSEMVPMAL
jgi:hypothetical protein